MKFGGTSVEDGAAFERVAQIVRSYDRASPVVVVSAMSGVTDALVTSLLAAAKGEPITAESYLERHLERHLHVISGLGSRAQSRMRMLVEDTRREILDLLRVAAASGIATGEQRDMISSHGERLSANLLALILEEHNLPATYVDARRCLLTDEEHGNARPMIRETQRQTRATLGPLLEAKRVPVLGGFIGATRNGVTTTLGRGSSDYSATLISAALGAIETQIWTDVDGVGTADPGLVESARTVSQLTYEEAAELARLGARVLHPQMFQPVVEPGIPVRICNSRARERRGTVICAAPETTPGVVKAIAHKTNLTQMDITSTPAFVANGFLRAIREIFELHKTQLDIVGMSPVGASLTLTETEALPLILQDLRQVGAVQTKGSRAIVSCIGAGLQAEPESARNVLSGLQRIDPTLIWQSTTSLNLIAIVDADSVGSVVRRLHQGLFE